MYSKYIGYNLKAIMKVMRLAIGRGRSRINITEIIDSTKNLIRYPLNNKAYGKNVQSRTDVMAFIPLCKYNDTGKAVDCELFDPVLTLRNLSLVQSNIIT